jgi:heme/copper-type cytochrome/quinol oxidase subunit 2
MSLWISERTLRHATIVLLVCMGCSDASLLPGAPDGTSRSGASDATGAMHIAAELEIREPYHIRMTGVEKRWHVQYADRDGRDMFEGNGPPLRDIHVPQNTEVVLVLNSADYIYTLAVQQYGIKEVAVPDLEFLVELPSSAAGTYEFAGDEMCGDPHPGLQGHLIVEPRERFLQWLHETSSEAAE